MVKISFIVSNFVYFLNFLKFPFYFGLSPMMKQHHCHVIESVVDLNERKIK